MVNRDKMLKKSIALIALKYFRTLAFDTNNTEGNLI